MATDNTGNYNLGSIANPVTYDKNGNITSLLRKGHTNNGVPSFTFGTMDNLVYTYEANSNKLKKVLDNGNDNEGFKDGVNQTTEFTYDPNGNLLTDANKGITSILWNHLNMPTEIKFNSSNTQKINYTYTANGIKVKKVVNDNGAVTTTDYAGAYQYVNNDLKFINNFDDGYVYPKSGGGYGYVYYYTDQLGNVRLSYQDTNGNYKEILDSDFETSFDGWEENGSVNYSLDSGRLKANVNSSWEGVRHPFTGITTVAGETLTVKLNFDKGNTVSNVRLYLPEYNSSGTLVRYNALNSNLQTGYSEHTLTMIDTGNSIGYVRIDKDNTNTGTETYFYIEQVSLVRNDLEILEENNYYPFGLKHKGYNNNITSTNIALKRKFGGKEYQDELGLNLMDFEARNFDPALGRWTTIDPVTHWSNSPYNAFDNNPIFWADPSGTTTVNSIQEAWDATPEGGSSTWNSDGEGGFCDDCKEGDSRPEMTGAPRGAGPYVTGGTQFYHSGTQGTIAGWYSQKSYNNILNSIALEILNENPSASTMAWLSKMDDSVLDNLTDRVNDVSDKILRAQERHNNYMKSGHAIGMYFSSPFFMPGLAMKLMNGSRTSSFAFHSGRGTTDVALSNGYKVLGLTNEGIAAYNFTRNMTYKVGSDAWKFWGKLSQAYARKIPRGSTVNVYITRGNNANPMTIFNRFEKPILEANKVKIKYNFID